MSVQLFKKIYPVDVEIFHCINEKLTCCWLEMRSHGITKVNGISSSGDNEYQYKISWQCIQKLLDQLRPPEN